MPFTHKIIPKFLTNEECKLLLDFSLQNLSLEPSEIMIDEKDRSNEFTVSKNRKSNQQFYQYYETFPFLLKKINNVVEECIQIKGYDLEYKKEPFQFTQYNIGDYFNWHTDSHYNSKDLTIASRYCSVVIQLNDEYSDGILEVKISDDETIEVDKGVGNLIIFLSELRHRVIPVTDGTRYTLVNWISIKPKENYKKTLL
jgi:predicted 2-oxoglutarate/Fe(II)-dependent dioxygenase YbiX